MRNPLRSFPRKRESRAAGADSRCVAPGSPRARGRADWWACCAILLLVVLSGQGASSQTSRTIKLVVPYPPGGGIDVTARLLAEQVGRMQGPTVVIED